MTLDSYVDSKLKIKKSGILECKEIEELIEKEGTLKAKLKYTKKIESMLENLLNEYKGKEEEEAIEKHLRNYRNGEKVWISGLYFYDPERTKVDAQFIAVPSLNNAANMGVIAKIPLAIAAMLRNSKIIKGLNKGMIPFSFGLKYLNKAYKECKKPKKDFKKIAKYGAAGVGGTLLFLPITVENGAVYYCIYLPFMLAFQYVTTKSMFKVFSCRERISDPLPPVEIIREDLEKQIKNFENTRKKYLKLGKTPDLVKPEKLVDELMEINKYLKHHLENIKLSDVDIEIDAVMNTFIGKGAAARADVVTETAELSASILKKVTRPELAKIYSHEIFHLDGSLNEGRANFRADRLLEDMAAHNENEGYDLQLELDRLIAVAHTYYLSKIQEMRTKGVKEKDKILEEVKKDMEKTGIKGVVASKVLAWLFPSSVKIKTLFIAQSIFGGNNPKGGYTIDYYKLLKRENLIK